MSLLNVFNTAGMGMTAQNIRLNTLASNLANADAVNSSIEQTYKARYPIFATVYNPLTGQPEGVEVKGIVESNRPLQSEFRPGDPRANEAGYVFLPNVDSVEAMADMLSAARTYQANLEIIDNVRQLAIRTLSLGQ